MNAKWITPSVTALDKAGHVDLEGNTKLYENLIGNGMDGILILGSIGEFFAIPMEEKMALVAHAVKAVNKRVPLIVGTNSMLFEECVEFSNYALDQGADAVMVIAPFYFNIPDDGVEYFYSQLAERVHGNLYFYNFPARTGYALKPEMMLKLAKKYKNIKGVKDTVGNMDSTRDIIQIVKKELPDFEVYSGFDEFFGHNILSGGNGCIGGISNFIPNIASGYAKAARADDLAGMCESQRKIDNLMKIYGIGEQFVPIIKKAVQLTGVDIEENVTAPLLPPTETQIEKIRQLLVDSGIDVVKC